MSKELAVKNYDALQSMIGQESVVARFEQALGKRAGAFIASLLTIVSGSPALMECEPKTILAGAIRAAVLDLPLVQDLGYACLVPFNNGKTGKKEAQFQIMTNGYKQLALRSKQYEILNTAKIFEGQQVIEDQLTGQIRLNGKRISDKAIGWVSYFKLKSGYEKFLFMSLEDIHKHGKKYSKSYSNPQGLWTTNPEVMEAKTVTKLNLKRNGILSVYMVDDEDNEFMQPINIENTFDVIEGEAETQDEEPQTQTDEPGIDVARLVEEGCVPDAMTAVTLLVECPYREHEQVKTWFKIYFAYKDLGANHAQCVKYANSGELPK
jgi:recombination protein RecT